jgi:hypothetical protein
VYRNYQTKDFLEYLADTFTLYDVIMGIITTILVVNIGKWTKNKYYKNTIFESFFWYGFLFRIICAWAIAMVYCLYYKGGDSHMYYAGAVDIRHETWGYWLEFITDIWQNNHDYSRYGNINHNTAYYLTSSSNGAVIRLGLIANIISFDSFISITIWCSTLAFIGTWLTYKSFLYFYPAFYKELGFFILFFPSAIFWTSGFSKEPICIGALGIMMYCVTMAIFRAKKIGLSVFGIIASGVALYITKPYIIVAFGPALLFWVFLQYNHKINNAILRRFSMVFVLLIALVGGSFALAKLTQSDETKRYATEAIIESITKTQKNMQNDKISGSKFSLGEFDPSPAGLIKMVPSGINATLFRPYIWEVRNPIMMLSAFEGTFLLLITLILLYRFKFNVFKIFNIVISSPLVTFSLVFTFIFAGAIGVSVFNFGALVRYKVPCLPFFGLALAVLWSKSQGVKKKNSMKNNAASVV